MNGPNLGGTSAARGPEGYIPQYAKDYQNPTPHAETGVLAGYPEMRAGVDKTEKSRGAAFSKVAQGLKFAFVRLPAILVGGSLLAAGAICVVPVVWIVAAINIVRANVFAGIGYGIGKFADWVNKEKDEKATSSSLEPKLSRAQSYRNAGITGGELGINIVGAICIAIPLGVGWLGRGALQFGIGEGMYKSTFEKVEDGFDNVTKTLNTFFLPKPTKHPKQELELEHEVLHADLKDNKEVAVAAPTRVMKAVVDQISGNGAASYLRGLKLEHVGLNTIMDWTVEEGGVSFVAEGTPDAGESAIKTIRNQTKLPLPSLHLGKYSETGKVWVRITDPNDIMKLYHLGGYL